MAHWLTNLFGPVYTKEMLELARRPRTFVLRTLYGLIILYLMSLVWSGYEHRTGLRIMAKLAQELFIWISNIQYLTVYVLTPFLVCGLIVEERSAGTLDLLFLTHLSDREIVVGKLASRLTVLFLVIVSGLPALCLTMLYGGVSPERLIGVTIATIVAAIVTSAFGIYYSVVCRTTIRSVGWTFCVVVVLTLLPCGWVLAPHIAMVSMNVDEASWTVLGLMSGLLTIPLVLSAYMLVRAVGRLRGGPPPRPYRRREFEATLGGQRPSSGRETPRQLHAEAALRAALLRERANLWETDELMPVELLPTAVVGLIPALVFASAIVPATGLFFVGWMLATLYASWLVAANPIVDRRRGFRDLLLATPMETPALIEAILRPIRKPLRWIGSALLALTVIWFFKGDLVGLAHGIISVVGISAVLVLHGLACSLAGRRRNEILAATLALPLVVVIAPFFLPTVESRAALLAFGGGWVGLTILAWHWFSRLATAGRAALVTISTSMALLACIVLPAAYALLWGPVPLAVLSPAFAWLADRSAFPRGNALLLLCGLQWLALGVNAVWLRYWICRNFEQLVDRPRARGGRASEPAVRDSAG